MELQLFSKFSFVPVTLFRGSKNCSPLLLILGFLERNLNHLHTLTCFFFGLVYVFQLHIFFFFFFVKLIFTTINIYNVLFIFTVFFSITKYLVVVVYLILHITNTCGLFRIVMRANNSRNVSKIKETKPELTITEGSSVELKRDLIFLVF